MDDAELVQRACDGDERAMNELVGRHHASAYRVALRITGEEDLAADAAQDAFIKAFAALDGFRGDATFRSWLLTITSNQAKSLLRRRGRRREVSFDDTGALRSRGPDPSELATARAEVERAERCLRALPEKQRMSVELRLFEGLGFREIGEITDSSEGAARVNYHHGIHRLREMLESG